MNDAEAFTQSWQRRTQHSRLLRPRAKKSHEPAGYRVLMAWPVYAWKVLVPTVQYTEADPLMLAVLRLCRAGCRSADEIHLWLGIQRDLAQTLIQHYQQRGFLDAHLAITSAGAKLVNEGDLLAFSADSYREGWIFRDALRSDVLPVLLQRPDIPVSSARSQPDCYPLPIQPEFKAKPSLDSVRVALQLNARLLRAKRAGQPVETIPTESLPGKLEESTFPAADTPALAGKQILPNLTADDWVALAEEGYTASSSWIVNLQQSVFLYSRALHGRQEAERQATVREQVLTATADSNSKAPRVPSSIPRFVRVIREFPEQVDIPVNLVVLPDDPDTTVLESPSFPECNDWFLRKFNWLLRLLPDLRQFRETHLRKAKESFASNPVLIEAEATAINKIPALGRIPQLGHTLRQLEKAHRAIALFHGDPEHIDSVLMRLYNALEAAMNACIETIPNRIEIAASVHGDLHRETLARLQLSTKAYIPRRYFKPEYAAKAARIARFAGESTADRAVFLLYVADRHPGSAAELLLRNEPAVFKNLDEITLLRNRLAGHHSDEITENPEGIVEKATGLTYLVLAALINSFFGETTRNG